MDFDALVALPDSEKVFLAEINIKDQIDDENWIQAGGSDFCQNFLGTAEDVNDNIIAVNGVDFNSNEIDISGEYYNGAITVWFTPATPAAVTIDLEFQVSTDNDATWSSAYYVRIQTPTNETQDGSGVVRVTKELAFAGISHIRLYRIVVNNGAGNCTSINASISFSTTWAWYIDYTLGAVNKVEEDGSEYIERFTLIECHNNPSSFFYDFDNQKLYLHTSNSDDPSGPADYTIIAYIWQYFTDKQYTDQPNIYPRLQEALTDGGFEIWASATDLTNWTETIAGTSTVNRESTTVYDGGYSLKITVDAVPNAAYITQATRLDPRGKCKLSFYYQNSAATKIGKIAIYDSGSNVSLDSSGIWQAGVSDISLPSVTEWTEYELEFYAHADYTNYIIRFKGDDASTSVYYDKAKLTRYREDNFYLPYLNSRKLSPIIQAVSDYYIGAVTTQSTTFKFLDDGWWFPMLNNYIWAPNCEAILRLGAKGSDKEDFESIFTGRTQDKNVSISESIANIKAIDERALIFREIPTQRYWTTDFANLDSNFEGKVRRILWGQKENITPVCIDTTTYQYEIAAHEIESIIAVYKDGVILTAGGVDYTADLPNGRFTLTNDPENALITCDAKGKKCDFEDFTYSTNIADLNWDVLVNVNGINPERLDFESLRDLNAGRTQAHALYLNYAVNTPDLIRMFQASALFHFTPLLDGRFGFFRFKTESADAPILYNEDYDFFDVEWESSVYKNVLIKYDRDPTEDKWKTVLATESGVSHKYDKETTLVIETTLKNEAEAVVLAGWYLDSLKNPPKKIKTKISTIGFNMRPAERIVFNKTRKDANKDDITICDEEVYTILQLRKELSTTRVGLVAQDASQMSELAHADGYIDTPHEDEHTDVYTDEAYTDTHSDSHSDQAYQDSYTDIPHSDSHTDGHGDGYLDHDDDPVHNDKHTDSHTDTHSDTAHTDSHTDTSHKDSHSDSHGDGHNDFYTDEHTDVPHTDEHVDS